jgi:hypothetical protein
MRYAKRMLVAGLALVGLLSPSSGTAQASIFVGAAAAVPLADLGTVADVGLHGYVGGTVEVGETGFALGVTGFFSSHPHVIGGDRSDLYGANVLAGYTIAEAYEFSFTAWAGLGGMVHARKSETFPGLNASKRGLAGTVGASVSRSIGRIGLFASGLYTLGLGDLRTDSYPTEFVTLGGGVSIPLGVD